MTSKSALFLSIAVAAALTAGAASAHAPKDRDAVGNIAKLSAAANLAFQGKVVKVEYRQSAATAGQRALPQTFVTYQVGKVLQGKAGKTITLRFAGGTDGRGGFLDVEGVPVFQEGDEDILFVQGNGDKGCPLVQCEFGRYRVLGGAVYEAHGSPVLGVEKGRIVAKGKAPAAFEQFSYPAPTFEQLSQRPEVKAAIRKAGLTMAQAAARYAAEAPKVVKTRMVDPLILGEAGADKAASGPAKKGMAVDGFVGSLGAAIQAMPARSMASVQSADPNQAIAAPRLSAKAPKSAPSGAKALLPGEQPIRKD